MKMRIIAAILCFIMMTGILAPVGIAADGEEFNEAKFLQQITVTQPKVRQSGLYSSDLSDAHFTFAGEAAAVTPGTGAIVAGVKDNCAYSMGKSTYINMSITPEKGIPVISPNVIVKFRFKIETEEPGGTINYLQIKLHDRNGEVEVSSNTNKLMKNGVWYEGQIESGKAFVVDGKRAFKVGDVISSITVMSRNMTGKYISTYVEYFFAEEGALSSWMIPDSGTDVIKNIVTKAKTARPGDVITIPDGVYSNAELDIIGTGTKEKPIIIKAENPGSVILNGASRLTIDGDYIVVDGLYFKDAYSYRIIHFKPTSNYCRLTNTVILNGNDDDTELDSHWTTVQGKGHEVDHCFFRYKTAYSCLLDGIGKNFYFHHNYIGYTQEGALGNGYEAARTQLIDSLTKTVKGSSPANFLFEYNFLDRCNGEDESVSIKSNNNTIRYNTFYDSSSAVTCRQGDNQIIYGNLFIGGKETTRTTGVRFMGNNGILRDNYFFNLPLSSGAVLCESGNPLGNPSLTYYPPVNALVENNSFINCDIAISLNTHLGQGQYRTMGGNGRIENNLMVSNVGFNYMIPNVGSIEGYKFSNNIAFGKPLGLPEHTPGITIKEPVLKKIGQFLYFPETPGVGADPAEIAKTPKTPLDLFEDGSWIKAKIIEAQNQEFVKNGFKFDPITEETYIREKNDPDFTNTVIWPASYSVLVLKVNGNKAYKGNRLTYVDGENHKVTPKMINEITMVPIRYISENLEALVDWNSNTQTVSIETKEGIKILLTIGDKEMVVNGKNISLESPAYLESGRTMLPLRAVSEALGCLVRWDERELIVISKSKTFFDLFISNELFLLDALKYL